MMEAVMVNTGAYKTCITPVQSPPLTYKHSVFLHAGWPSDAPANSIKALKVKRRNSRLI